MVKFPMVRTYVLHYKREKGGRFFCKREKSVEFKKGILISKRIRVFHRYAGISFHFAVTGKAIMSLATPPVMIRFHAVASKASDLSVMPPSALQLRINIAVCPACHR